MFCDEPNSGLDPLTSIVIDNLLHELTHEYDMTTVINTHDMNSVFEIGEKVLFCLLYTSRGGQVFFIHNRVDNIRDIQYMIHRLIPGIKSCVGHGQMSGEELETVMHDFVRGDYDVLIATTIVESGLDIPNANTIIINPVSYTHLKY